MRCANCRLYQTWLMQNTRSSVPGVQSRHDGSCVERRTAVSSTCCCHGRLVAIWFYVAIVQWSCLEGIVCRAYPNKDYRTHYVLWNSCNCIIVVSWFAATFADTKTMSNTASLRSWAILCHIWSPPTSFMPYHRIRLHLRRKVFGSLCLCSITWTESGECCIEW